MAAAAAASGKSPKAAAEYADEFIDYILQREALGKQAREDNRVDFR